jgi:hypothetical protein
MKTFIALAIAVLALVGSAYARTNENVLFVCEGELLKDSGGYEIMERGVNAEDDYPMDCYIDPQIVRKILAVCRVGDICIVSAKGESGNGNRHLIQKVFEVQRASWTVGELRRNLKDTCPPGQWHDEQRAFWCAPKE